MNLSYKVNNTETSKEVRVNFEPPLSGYDEVKPRLLGMTADAQESLGMVRSQYNLTTYCTVTNHMYSNP